MGGTLPREASPCGVVLDRNALQLMADPVRHWPRIADLRPAITEVLLVPFHRDDVPVGTVWVLSHAADKRFDAEDARVVTSLSAFASAAAKSLAHLDALEAASRSKDLFLAVLSHELRTPLTPALLTAVAMEEDESLSAAVRADARTIRRNIEVETGLIDDLLDVTRAATGKVEVRAEVVVLHDVLRECAAMCRPAPGRRQPVHVDLRLDAARHVVSGDPSRLRQVFSNLLSNAVKFTPDGGRVAITTADAGGGRIRVAVSDTGVGIDAAALPHVFDPFEQGGRAMTRQYGGLGLGLAIAKGLVEAHGGGIVAESDGTGRGTTMSVTLPTVAVAAPASVAAAPTPPVADRDVELKILLVEDHEDSRTAMTRLLRTLRHRIETAGSVGDALTVAEGFDFDLLISDVGLPDGTGLDLMRALLARRRPVRGIALTGYGSEADVAEALAAGFTMHLTKPVRVGALKDAVRRVGALSG
jgi:signal transduction histidine kinase